MTARTLNALTTVNSFAALPDAFYTRLAPQPLNHPRLLHANPDAAALIGWTRRLSRRRNSWPCFPASSRCLAATRWPPSTAATSSASGPANWATGAHLLGEVQGRPAAGSCSSRAPA